MEKQDHVPWVNVVYYLEVAALYPKKRDEMIKRALLELLVCLPAVGTALIWPCQDRNVPWKVYYTGVGQETMKQWLKDRLGCSLDATLGMLRQDQSKLSDMPIPHFIRLQPASRCPAGLWIVWTPLSLLPYATEVEVREALEALIEVESSEELFFPSGSLLSDPGLVDALAQGDTRALPAVLSMACLVGKAELAFWGRAHPDIIEMKDPWGARNTGLGFKIRRDEGMAGRAAAGRKPIVVDDYHTCPYRISGVSEKIDTEEDICSGIALPVHSRIGEEKSDQVAGILYVARRIVKPFSLSESLLVQRMTCLLEPLRPITRPPLFLSPGLPSVADEKPAWYKVVLHANQQS